MIDSIIREQLSALTKEALNSLYPNDFEFYMIALELVSIDTGKTLKYFIFPVMPNSMSSSRTFNNQVTETFTGVTLFTNNSFKPFDISLVGDFGKDFKILLGEKFEDLVYSFDTINDKIKTGYGCIKLLEEILDESVKTDENGQRLLFYYNLAFNQRYIVSVNSFTPSQELGKNGIWSYNLSLKALANANSIQIVKEEDTQELIKQSTNKKIIQSTIKSSLRLVKSIINV